MTEVEKVKIVDSRILQPNPKYAINIGAASVSNVPFQASSSSSSTLSFNINAPSQNVFMDRTMPITAGVNMKVTANAPFAMRTGLEGKPVLRFGTDCALPAFPLQSGMSSLTATINSTNVTANQKDVMYELLRLSDMKKSRKQRTTPTMLDKYVSYRESATFDNTPIRGFNKALDNELVPNGAFANIVYTDANGVPVPGNVAPAWPVTANWPDDTDQTVTVYYRYTVTENLVLSPFIYSECHDDETGLYGINNIQVIANFGDQSKALRIAPKVVGDDTVTYSNISFNGANPFVKPVINCVFRAPPLGVPLPQRSIIPYLETPRYVTANSGLSIVSGGSSTISSNTITLSQIPDMLLIYCKPSQVTDPHLYGDFYLSPRKISMNMQNVSGILSSMTREQLFNMSARNGLNMDYNQFIGEAQVTSTDTDLTTRVPLVGGFLVLRPGIDFALNSGSAPGLGGNFTLQFNLDVYNQTNMTIDNPVLYCMAVNSGFFVSENGNSFVSTAPITEQALVNAPVAGDTQTLERYVGGSFWSKLGSTLKGIVQSPVTKQVVKGLSKVGKNLARNSGNPQAKLAADIADSVGLGRTTGGQRKLQSLLY